MSSTNERSTRFTSSDRYASDAWQLSHASLDWSQSFEQLTRGAFSARTQEVWLGPIQVVHEQVGPAVEFRGTPWKGARVFIAYLPTPSNIYYDGRAVAHNVIATHRWDSVHQAAANGGTDCVLVAIDEEYFGSLSEKILGRRLFGKTREVLISASDPSIVSGFRDGVLSLIRDVDTQPELLTSECSRQALQESLVRLLFRSVDTVSGGMTCLPRSSTRAYIVNKAIEFMDSRLSQPISIAEVCNELRICSRTLRYSFQQMLGVSPMHYLLARRLNGARRDLLCSSAEHTVVEIGLRWGFWHMSRFAQFYRRTFGECPSDTWRRASSAPPTKARVYNTYRSHPQLIELPSS
jgi:AraC family transcriptional regulator, ethanolamine operon transcriptional activator